jgi:voltage-gated potassium channel
MFSHDHIGRVRLGPLEYAVQALIVLSLIAFALNTLPDITERQRTLLDAFELFSIAAFTVEYLARLLLSKPPRAYAFSFFGLIDLLAILPFFLLGLDLRSIRAFRLLRLLRILKLARYSMAMQRYHRAFILIKEELALFGVTALILLFVASAGIYHFENPAQPDKFRSIFDSMWWALCTLTTVGYGDIYPITAGGRFFTFLVLLVGLGFIAVPTGLFASALSKARQEE